MTYLALNAYHIMWLFVFFDLPVTTKPERKAAAKFRKDLEHDGFTMKQYSVYIRYCASYESAEVHTKHIGTYVPPYGKVSIFCVTDKQYSRIKNYWGKPESISKSKLKQTNITAPIQLELF